MIEDLLKSFRAADAEEAATKARLLQFVASHGSAVAGREIIGDLGHVTSAAWILNNEASRVLLVFGSKEDAWKLPGSHCEALDGSDCFKTACFEASRALAQPIDEARASFFAVYEQHVPAYWNTPAHLHFELIFRFDTPHQNIELPRGAKWFSLPEAAQLGDGNIARFSQK